MVGENLVIIVNIESIVKICLSNIVSNSQSLIIFSMNLA